jgi:glycosyltransferase involved in cell wall biosynthesis
MAANSGGGKSLGDLGSTPTEIDVQTLMQEVELAVISARDEKMRGGSEAVLWTFGRNLSSASSGLHSPNGNFLADGSSPIINIFSKRWDIWDPEAVSSHRRGISGWVVRYLKRSYLKVLHPFHNELLRKQRNINAYFAETLRKLQKEVEAQKKRAFVGESQGREGLEVFRYFPKFTVLMPVWNSEPEYLRKAILSVVQQRYPFWELSICDDGSDREDFKSILEEYDRLDERIHLTRLSSRQGIAAATNAALAKVSGDFVGFLDHDDELDPDTLWEAARWIDQDAGADLLYTDEDHLSSEMRVEPRFKPSWSPDLLFSFNYICHFVVIRTSLLKELGGLRPGFEGAQDYDLLLRATEKTANIKRIPRILYHWRKSETSVSANMNVKPQATINGQRALASALERRGIKGEVEVVVQGIYRVKRALVGSPLISIVIPSKDNVRDLKNCLESIRSQSTYRNYEIIIVDNGSEERQTTSYLSSLPDRILRSEGPFNFSRLNNLGARQARGEILLFLNDDTKVITLDWLEAMLEQVQRNEVGVVGAKLIFPNGTVQHAGIVLNVDGRPTAHIFVGANPEDWGYENALRTVRNYSAVTGACLMIRRGVFEEVGGFDEQYEVVFGDVDFCLKVREKGFLVVWTPYALLQHREFGTRPRNQDPPQDTERFVTRWQRVLDQGDPYYNPNLSAL